MPLLLSASHTLVNASKIQIEKCEPNFRAPDLSREYLLGSLDTKGTYKSCRKTNYKKAVTTLNERFSLNKGTINTRIRILGQVQSLTASFSIGT